MLNWELSVGGKDEIEDVADDMIPESRIVKIIDEMELIKDEFDFFDEADIQHELEELKGRY